jgi:GNAT superfamily N-acetyltransferase
MPTILHLARTLQCRPTLPELPGVRLRRYSGHGDVDLWLDLRRRSFESEPVGVRPWRRSDFQAEILDKSWWSPDRLWFAEAERESGGNHAAQPVGTIALAQRGLLPVIHWLCVLPEFRRRGVGRLLMAALETYCWDAGQRELGLETHELWDSAVKFYSVLGYQ